MIENPNQKSLTEPLTDSFFQIRFPISEKTPIHLRQKRGMIFIGFLLFFGWLITVIGVNNAYLFNRMVWNTKIGNVNVGGKTVTESRELLKKHINQFRNTPVKISSNEGAYEINNSEIDPHFDLDLILFDAFNKGHRHSFIENHATRLFSIFSTTEYSLLHWFDESRFTATLSSYIPKLRDNPVLDASIKLTGKEFIALPGKDGFGFNYEESIQQYDRILDHLNPEELKVNIFPKSPDIDLSMAQFARRRANQLIRRRLTMIYSYDGYNYDRWTIDNYERKNWIEFKKIKEYGNFSLYPVLNSEQLRNDLNRRIAPYMYRAKEDILIKSVNGKIEVEGVAKDGYYLDVPKTIKAINHAIINNELDTTGNYAVPLQVAHLLGGVANPNNEFGISDVLATGVTDFFGSPENRKFNINHASPSFQNVIIEPGKKFSFIKQMGKVDSTTGYEKELVIVNGDSTEPQYGGGMCQVSSTLFRTVFFAGLKIIKRSNHSFEVKYYLPSGLDATVADFGPDLMFENDTKSLILMQNLVDLKRTKMYFKLFGKNDGRQLHFDGPNDDGPVGEKNEHYRITWYRHVEFPDGKIRKEKFMSVYRNKDLVKKHQPENLLVKIDSSFVPVSLDTTKFEQPLLHSDSTAIIPP
jgi:vancomycin resistance protein YoaR